MAMQKPIPAEPPPHDPEHERLRLSLEEAERSYAEGRYLDDAEARHYLEIFADPTRALPTGDIAAIKAALKR